MRNALRLAFFTALLAGPAGPAAAGVSTAPPPPCGGTNILTRLASSDPALHGRIQEAAVSLENG